MTGKIFKTIFCVLNIGAMQLAVLGCLTNRDCSTQTTGSRKQKCCYSVQPPRCMDWFSCYFLRTAETTEAPFPSDYTLPDYNIPDISPDNNYDNYDNDYNSSDSTSSSPGAIIGSLIAVILLGIFIFLYRHVRQKGICFERPPVETTNATSRTNLVSQKSERLRLVTIAVRQDESESVSQNIPPEGEPPFLSEGDVLQSLQTPSDPEPSSLDSPKYEELPLLPYDTAQVPNPSLTTIPIQPNVDLPAVNPPSYDESQATTNVVASCF